MDKIYWHLEKIQGIRLRHQSETWQRYNDIGHKIWTKKTNIFFTLILIFVGSSASIANLDIKAAKSGEVEKSGSSASIANLDIKAAKSGEVEQNRQNDTPLAEIPTSIEEGTSHVDSETYIVPLLLFFSLCPLYLIVCF